MGFGVMGSSGGVETSVSLGQGRLGLDTPRFDVRTCCGAP